MGRAAWAELTSPPLRSMKMSIPAVTTAILILGNAGLFADFSSELFVKFKRKLPNHFSSALIFLNFLTAFMVLKSLNIIIE